MRRRLYILALIIPCVVTEIILIQVLPLLESYNYPLLSSLTCIETEDSKDLYWTINQIEITSTTKMEENRLVIVLKNTIPNFDSYFYRTSIGENWQKAKNNTIVMEIAEGQGLLEVQAATMFGVKLPPVKYSIVTDNGAVIVKSDETKVIDGTYDFRFENAQSSKIKWLQAHTLPVIGDVQKQWDKFSALLKWVREQVPYKDPVMESQWDAQRILQAVWDDPSVGFICDAFAATYVSTCASVGLNARMVHLGDGRGNGHYATEVWSDEYHKWNFVDPLYNCYFTIHGVPLSALELHLLWKNKTWEDLEKQGDQNEYICFDASHSDYFNLFKDIQLINANDFLSRPFTNVFDLLNGNIQYMRWVDESNPPYNKLKMGCQLLAYYYLPKVLRNLVIPFVIPGCIVLCAIMVFRKK